MILESIEIERVGAILGVARIGPLCPGLNVLCAPNESGKTTFVKAAMRCFFDRHTCMDQEIKHLQPAGTGLSPRMSVSFETGRRKFRVQKTFCHNPKSELFEWRDDGWRQIEDGDAADQKVLELVGGERPGRGATTAAHWGFMTYLWARQGEAVRWFKWEGSTGQTVKDRLAKVEIDQFVDDLAESLRREAATSLTQSGCPKAGGPLKLAEDALFEIDARLDDISRKRKETEHLTDDYQKLEQEISVVSVEYAEKQKEAEALQKEANKIEVLRKELDAARDRLEVARKALSEVTTDEAAIREVERGIVSANGEITRLRETIAGHESDEKDLRARLERATRSAEESAELVAKARTELARVSEIHRHRSEKREFEAKTAQLKKVKEKERAIALIQTKLASVANITPQRMTKLNDLEQVIRETKTKIDASGLRVELTPDKAAKAVAVCDGSQQKLAIKSKETRTLNAAQALSVRLSGWGEVSIRSGAEQIQSLVDQCNENEAKLKEILSEAGVPDVNEAREAKERRKELERDLKEAQKSLAEKIEEAGCAGSDELRVAVAERNRRFRVLEDGLQLSSKERSLSETDIETRRTALKSEVERREENEKAFDKQRDGDREALDKAARQIQAVEREKNELESNRRALESKNETIKSRYPGGIQETSKKAAQAFAEAKALFDAAEARMPADYQTVSGRAVRAAKAVEEVAAELDRQKMALAQLDGALKTRGAEDLFTQEAIQQERRAQLDSEVRAIGARGRMARLFAELIAYRKTAATRSVLGPLEEGLSTAFAELTGDRSRRVFLGADLEVAGIGRNPDELIPFDSLSQGAKEQLLLCLRLAVARELAATEPQLVILDDVLANTDPARQQRVLDVLKAASEQLQILILTCHPDRYRGVGIRCEMTTTGGQKL